MKKEKKLLIKTVVQTVIKGRGLCSVRKKFEIAETNNVPLF